MFCSAFPTFNSLQIIVRSHLPSELRWQVFSLCWTWSHRSAIFGQTDTFRCYRSKQLGVTDFTAEKAICHLFLTFVPAPLDDSCPLPASQSICCFALWLKDQTYFDSHSRRILLGNWCQRGRERSHQSLILQKGEERILQIGRKRSPRCLVFKEERSHMSLEGKIHVHVC